MQLIMLALELEVMRKKKAKQRNYRLVDIMTEKKKKRKKRNVFTINAYFLLISLLEGDF